MPGVPNGIGYRLVAPDLQIFLNTNPSGNREWEQFKIQLVHNAGDIPDGACPVGGYDASPTFVEPDDLTDDLYPASDCRTLSLPAGPWEVQLDGMDMQNLNFWFFSFKVEPIEPPCEGAECPGEGVVAPTTETCADFASGEIETEYTMFYTGGANIGNVSPGVIFFFTAVTVAPGEVLSVSQSTPGVSPVMLLHNNEARVYTDTCQGVSATVSQDPTTGEVTFGGPGVAAGGTFILRLKYSPKSLKGKPVPNPTPGLYTFIAQLDGSDVIGSQNDTPLALTKKNP